MLGVVVALACGAVASGQTPATAPAPPAAEIPEAPAETPAEAPAETETQPAATAPAAADVFHTDALQFDEAVFDLTFEAQADQRDVRYDTGNWWREQNRQRNRAMRLEETAGLRTAGVLFDEKIARFDLAGRFGFSQERFTERGPGYDLSEDPHGELYEYDMNLTLLPRGLFSASTFASRHDSRVPRAFQPSLDRTLEKYGAALYLNSPTFPMRLTFEHTWDELTSRTRSLEDDEKRGEDALGYEGTWQISDRQSLQLEYQYEDTREQYSGTRTRYDTQRHYLNLNHMLRFGPDGRSSWETLARLQDESGDIARDDNEILTRLRLQHADTFSTFYSAQWMKDRFHELSTETGRADIGATHELGKTLVTTGQFYGLRQNTSETVDFNEWGGLANTSFSHEHDLGRLSANLSYTHTAVDASDGDRRGIVIAESVTFRDPLPAHLAQRDIDSFTIIVTDAGRRRTYLRGRDYWVISYGRYTALQRVPTGEIADRETVLVTYSYHVYDDYDVSRDRLDFRLQQEFKFGLTPYYAASVQDEDYDQDDYLRWQPRNVNRHRLGATFKQPRWSVGAEYEYNDDALDPFQAMHWNADVVLLQRARHQLDAKATLSRYWFEGTLELPERDTTLLDLGTAYRYLLGRGLEATAGAMYRYEDDSLYGLTHGVDLSAALEWRIGYFSLRFEAEYDLLSLPDSRDEGASFWVKLKREFPLVSKGAL